MNERPTALSSGISEIPLIYKNYLKTCRLLELTGGIIMILSALANHFLRLNSGGFVIPAILLGAIILMLGASSLRPQNQIKAFAVQLFRNPVREMAEGLLAALLVCRPGRLAPRAFDIMHNAIESYCSSPNADPELAGRLSAAAEPITKGLF